MKLLQTIRNYLTNASLARDAEAYRMLRANLELGPQTTIMSVILRLREENSLLKARIKIHEGQLNAAVNNEAKLRAQRDRLAAVCDDISATLSRLNDDGADKLL